MNNELKELVLNLQNEIAWENFEHEGTGKYLKLGEVIATKIGWIIDEENLDEQSKDILEEIQEKVCPILNLLDKELNGE